MQKAAIADLMDHLADPIHVRGEHDHHATLRLEHAGDIARDIRRDLIRVGSDVVPVEPGNSLLTPLGDGVSTRLSSNFRGCCLIRSPACRKTFKHRSALVVAVQDRTKGRGQQA